MSREVVTVGTQTREHGDVRDHFTGKINIWLSHPHERDVVRTFWFEVLGYRQKGGKVIIKDRDDVVILEADDEAFHEEVYTEPARFQRYWGQYDQKQQAMIFLLLSAVNQGVLSQWHLMADVSSRILRDGLTKEDVKTMKLERLT
ncbi:MAG: hypothetical protein AAB638_00495, partial [Patescibacteria group bacterium]